MSEDRITALEKELASLRDEVLALRKRTGDHEQRLSRLEVREELLESPASPGDAPVEYK